MYALPDDINPDSFRCVRVYYPDSPGYRRALFAAVSYLQNWFAWQRDDAHRGKDAAAKWREAYTLTVNDLLAGLTCDCEEAPDPEVITEYIEIITGGGSPGGFEEMPCLDLTNLIKIEGGVLYVRNSCCEWETVGTLTTQENPTPEIITPADPIPDDLSCRKAKYMSDKMVEIAGVGWDIRNSSVYTWINDMRQNYPAYELSIVRLYTAYQALNALNLLGLFTLWTDAWPTTLAQATVCRWVNVLPPNTLEVTTGELDEMRNIVKNLTSGFAESYLSELMKAIGASGFSWMATEAQSLSTAYCDCPDVIPDSPTDPDAAGWYMSAPLETTHYGSAAWQAVGWQGEADHDVYGVFFVLNTTNEGVVKRMSCSNTANDLHLNFADVDISLTPDSSDHLESKNQLYPMIQLADADIVEDLAQSRGFTVGWMFTSGVCDPTISTPGGPVGNVLGFRLDHEDDVSVVTVEELRLIHNINSPSHTP